MKPHTSKKISAEEHRRPTQSKEAETLIVQSLIKSGLFLQRELNQVCRQYGLNTNQFIVLNEIILQGPLSQRELCERLLFEKSNLSKIVKTLQDKELVSISVAPEDRRLTLLIETDQGAKLLKKCLQNIYQSSTDLMSVLSDDEIPSTLKILKKLEKAFKRMADKQ